MLLFRIMFNKASAHLWTLGNNIYTRKSSSTKIYLFKVKKTFSLKEMRLVTGTVFFSGYSVSLFHESSCGHPFLNGYGIF